MQMLFQHIKTLILPALLACVMMLCGLFSASAALTNGIGTVYGFYIGPSVDLTGANLGYADLTGANLAGATLVNACVADVTESVAFTPPTPTPEPRTPALTGFVLMGGLLALMRLRRARA